MAERINTMSKVTAETLTDEQIRAERTLQREDGNRINVSVCDAALGHLHGARGQVASFAAEEILRARELVAASINARAAHRKAP